MYYFYCPKCGYECETDAVPQNAQMNSRGGWGVPIYHDECPQCCNPDAGYMQRKERNKDEIVYYRSVIGLYQEGGMSHV